MRSTFFGFNIARSGLFAAQRALDITGHNIANVNTKGYTRQRLDQAPSNPLSLPGGQGMIGTGVSTLGIKQIRVDFLDFKYRGEANAQGHWEVRRDGLQFIEAIMNEPSKTGISTVLDEFFSSIQELSKNPQELTNRSLVRQRGVAFTNSLNHMYNQLEKMVKDVNFDIVTTVNTINSYSDQIAVLNEQILRSEIGGSSANDLRDQRNLLIDELSKIVNVEVLEVVDPNDLQNGGKKTVIQINGQPLVNHNRTFKLSAEDKKLDDPVRNEVKWANGSSLNVSALKGELRSLLDLRDETEGKNKGIPYYMNQLDEFARKFAEEVNKLHFEGFGLNGDTGILFFTANGVSTEDMMGTATQLTNAIHQGITAKNIGVALDLDDPNKIAASSAATLLPGDGSIALKIAQIRHDSGMYEKGKPEDFIKSLISNLGVDTQEAMRNATNQIQLTELIDNERQAISGVSMDEELSRMVMYQHSYNASARMVNTMDEMLDTIINRLGLVGR